MRINYAAYTPTAQDLKVKGEVEKRQSKKRVIQQAVMHHYAGLHKDKWSNRPFENLLKP